MDFIEQQIKTNADILFKNKIYVLNSLSEDVNVLNRRMMKICARGFVHLYFRPLLFDPLYHDLRSENYHNSFKDPARFAEICKLQSHVTSLILIRQLFCM